MNEFIQNVLLICFALILTDIYNILKRKNNYDSRRIFS